LERPSEVLAEQLNLPRGQGLVVEQVQPDSAAARAGLKSNDILLELNGKPVSSDPREFSRMLDEIKPNTPVDALVLRKGQKETVKGLALPESRPSRRAVPRLSAPRTSTRVPSGLPGSPNRGPVGASVQITITRTGDDFIARRQEGRLVISVKGTVAGGKVNIAEIRIEADGRVETYTSLDQVPAAYRDRVQSLIEQSTKGSASGRSGKVDGR
jgi:membrane-associated protease RseP (regulator of RpoE activity)